MFHEALTVSAWHAESCQAFAILTLVCNSSCSRLARRLMELQHAELDLIISTSRVYVDQDTSLEVIILRGNRGRLHDLAARLCGLKGVHAGKMVVATVRPTPGTGMITHLRGPDDEDFDLTEST